VNKLKTILLLSFLISCSKDKKDQPEVFIPEFLSYKYTAIVNVNGIDVLKYIKATKYYNQTIGDSAIYIEMNSTDPGYYYYSIFFKINCSCSGTYVLHSVDTVGSPGNTFSYLKVCCYTNPDAIVASYRVAENDSANNSITLYYDSVNSNISGHFKVTMAEFSVNDTVRLRCDTFYCKFNNQ
jgi:hypothetical protein